MTRTARSNAVNKVKGCNEDDSVTLCTEIGNILKIFICFLYKFHYIVTLSANGNEHYKIYMRTHFT